MATWYNTYALRDNNCDPSPCVHCPGQPSVGCTPSECPSFPCANDCGLDWKPLNVEGDDWPLTFIVNQRSGGVPSGVVSGKEGKQMSFTDLTHK